MEKIKVIHDAVGHTLTVWLGDSSQEYVCEETQDEVVMMKDKKKAQGTLRFVLPRKIGKVTLEKNIPLENIRKILRLAGAK